MKKALLTVILIFASILSWGQIQFTTPDKRVSILKDGCSAITHSPYRFIAVGMPDGKYGFACNDSKLTLKVDAIYEGVFHGYGGLVGIKYNGKWGIFDTKLEFSHLKDQPVVKCEYDDIVEVFDDYRAKLVKDGVTYIFDIRKSPQIIREK